MKFLMRRDVETKWGSHAKLDWGRQEVWNEDRNAIGCVATASLFHSMVLDAPKENNKKKR